MKRRHSLAILVVCLLSVEALAQRSPLWSDLESGPYAIGFRTIKVFDHTRVVRLKQGREGVPTVGERAQPLLISVWYPAKKSATGRQLNFADYLYASALDAQLTEPTAERKKNVETELRDFYERPFNFPYGKMPDEGWKKLLDTEMHALADAEAEPGSYPLIVGVGGPLGNGVTNEYLASHGYIVAIVSAFGEARPGALGMEAYTRDLEFAIGQLRTFPNADRNRLGVYGFSFAGMPALLLGMRNSDVDAVAAIESAIFIDRYARTSLKPSASYDLTRLRVPFFHMFRRSESDKDEKLDDFRNLRYSRRYRYLLNHETLVHQDFSTHGIGMTNVIKLRGKDEVPARRAFEMSNRYLKNFFDAYIKRDAKAKAFLDRRPEDNDAPSGLVAIERLDAVTPAPTANEFAALITRRGIDSALKVFEEARRQDPKADIFSEVAVNDLGYRFLRERRLPEAIAIFKLNLATYPRSANVYDSLAEAYEISGDHRLALEYYEKAYAALSTDESSAQAKAQLRAGLEERIKKLKGQ
jgi:tetratricopeptide (TPR) repeat protein